MSDERGPKERAYDEHFAPLVRQLIVLAKEHRISFAAQAYLDAAPEDEEHGDMKCTTWLPSPDATELEAKYMADLRRALYPQPYFAAFTITTRSAS